MGKPFPGQLAAGFKKKAEKLQTKLDNQAKELREADALILSIKAVIESDDVNENKTYAIEELLEAAGYTVKRTVS